ncbi:MAG: DUF3293 domain-containing protein [Betaproteobacteria bacterium]
MAMKTEGLAAAYAATTYCVFLPQGPLELRLEQANAALVRWLKDEDITAWAILTAHNPRSERFSAAENAERQSSLECKLLEQGYEPYVGENRADNGQWGAEETCFIPKISLPQAIVLARQFGQNALVFGEADGVPHLSWIDDEKNE